MNYRLKQLFLPIILLFLIIPCFVQAENVTIPDTHPYEVTEKPECKECHTDDTGVSLKPIGTFSHSMDWHKRHKFHASENDRLCRSCHRVSFCTDCHSYKEEMRPSLKYSGSSERWLPHRGDYLYQHRIDGRIDPAKCFRCHGRQNNQRCKRCHK